MQNITSFQILGAFVAFILGYICRLGLEYEHNSKSLSFWRGFFMFMFSLVTAALTFVFVVDKEWSSALKLIPVTIASFFGSVVVPGLGNIKAEFFTSIFKDVLRKWLSNNESNSEIQTNNKVSESEESTENLG